MSKINMSLARELIEMVNQDSKVRQELVKDGSLFDGYHPRMEKLHNKNGKRLQEIIEQYGFPGKSLVGEDASKAAWIILQHAISMPNLQRKSLPLLKELAKNREVPKEEVAMLEDRILIYEGKKQKFGTQFDWDEKGQLSPLPIEDPMKVDELRQSVDLPTLEVTIAQHRTWAVENSEQPPKDTLKKQKKYEDWLKRVGWRK